MSRYADIFELVPERCGKCAAHFFANPFMVEALASVGISHGKCSADMARDFYAEFHRRKHREPQPSAAAVGQR